MKLTNTQEEILTSNGHILIRGGPGSGKTTISIIKAAQITECDLKPEQKVLFLSFARASVSRVIEAIEHEQKIPANQRKRIDVETYHSFFWRLLRTHSYLVGLQRKLSILTPPDEAIALSGIRNEFAKSSKLTETEKSDKIRKEEEERFRLAKEEGRVCFSLFSHFVNQVLQGSQRIRRLISIKYPTIVLDEFQDTSEDQWKVVFNLGEYSELVAVADPEQRIYDWVGASPNRLSHFRDAFHPKEYDLCADNHRSGGTEIAVFGDDILKGSFKNGSYDGVFRKLYEPNPNQAWTTLLTITLAARKRLIEGEKKSWSLAILVPTKKMARLVSDAFRSPLANLPKIQHNVVIEMEAAILSAEIVAFFMQPDVDGSHFIRFIDLLCNFFRGKGGDAPTKTDMTEAHRIRNSYDDYSERKALGKALRKKSILNSVLSVYDNVREAKLSGNPDNDWRLIRQILENGCCTRLKKIADEVRNIRVLERGTQLRQALATDWRTNGAYSNALEIVRRAFVKEHFSMARKPEKGVVIMNMHKAKGKQFDEVIIFEGWPKYNGRKLVANPDRIVRSNSKENDSDQARYNLRVSVTRGKTRTTILTPKGDPCILLINRN